MQPESHHHREDPPRTGSTSASLLNQIRSQDAEAWRRLVDLYAPLVYGWCRHAELSPEDARDVAQEVFRSVFASIGDFRVSERRGNFRAWLRGIAQHRICDHFRRRRGVPRAAGGTTAQAALLQVPEPSEPSIPDDPPQAEDTLWRRALAMVRAEFEDRTWQAFWGTTVDGRSPADLAEELAMSIAAVYQAKSRVLHRLRDELADLEGGT